MVKGLSVVLPAYNEAPNIGIIVPRALEVLQGLAEEYEVIVVNDGSTDDTAEVTHELVSEHYPRVRLLSHVANQGYGAAIRTGFFHARYDLVFYTDADNQFDVSELEYFLPMMQDHDVVIGFRVYRYDRVLRSIVSWFYNRLVGILFRVKVRDVDCSFKLFRREVIDQIKIDSTNFFVDTELVARARKWNFRLAQKGVRHYPRVAGETTVVPGDVPRTLREIARMWQRIYLPTRRQLEETKAVEAAIPDSVIEAVPTPR
jgi:glycosyltransferase involved in cell wall biosynthesis